MKITTVNDYVDDVWREYPDLSREEVKRILVYGWKMILQYTGRSNDVYVFSKDIFMFIGKIPLDALRAFTIYCNKLAHRINFMFHRLKIQWDGYYYFALSERDYLDYLSQSKKRIKTFKNIRLYKILEECKVKEHMKQYIFRLNEDKTAWDTKFYKEIKTKNAELIIQRDCLNMKDVMTSENKFKYIQ